MRHSIISTGILSTPRSHGAPYALQTPRAVGMVRLVTPLEDLKPLSAMAVTGLAAQYAGITTAPDPPLPAATL